MRQEPLPSAPVSPTFWRAASPRARVAYLGSLLIAFALPAWEALRNRSPDTEPLQFDRLCLRLGCFAAVGVSAAIVGTVTFRSRRAAERMRQGLCAACGYDVRVSADRCPECGAPLADRPAA